MINSPGSLRGRLFLAFSMVTLIAALLPAILTHNTLYNERMDLAAQTALTQALLVKSVCDSGLGAPQMEKLFHVAQERSYRMTLLDASDTVLRDTDIDGQRLPELDNHADRPEIDQARATGQGISFRHSNSLGTDLVYAAVTLQNGGILRIAVPVAQVRRSLETEFSFLGVTVAGVAAFCLLLTALITKHVQNAVHNMAEVVASIPKDKSFRRLHEVPGKEFLPLAHAVNAMADSIEDYMEKTRDQHGQLESILESMHEGVLVLNPAGNIRRWNNALAALFPDIGSAQGKPVIEAIAIPELQSTVERLLAPEDLADDSAKTVQFELPPGRFLVAHLTKPLHSLESLGVVIVIYDATEIMKLGAMRKDFVSNISHELRTPLTAIHGYAEILMLAQDVPEDKREFASIIHAHSAALSRLTSDLLVLTKIENDKENMETVSLDAGSAFEDALLYCGPIADEKKVRFEVHLAETPVLANPSLLTQVFRNLLENACRYSPQNEVITISSRLDGKNVLFCVSDNGPGIPAEALPRIFERFYQIKKERNSGAAGIGLAICKHIIERHGGRIWAQSPYGEAATAMLFTLPAALSRNKPYDK
ncbi:PAS domain-containing sensor histidine kinase [Desulfovibrio sp. OttesenSCG-928-F20]|nr:PAS domain-containing sensor histidine kinase [Desulfovibrio sp. OttesenSCG-928-M16]MDL2291152.1 PAS domain-containing sensor histidine kinase [Desulfovibrio sp. OttesenSCG-928-F20]